jgi:hypothetical protein
MRAGAAARRKAREAGAARWEEALSWPAASLVAGSGKEGWACASASGHHGRRGTGRREGEALRAVSRRGPKRRPRPATATCAVAVGVRRGCTASGGILRDLWTSTAGGRPDLKGESREGGVASRSVS